MPPAPSPLARRVRRALVLLLALPLPLLAACAGDDSNAKDSTVNPTTTTTTIHTTADRPTTSAPLVPELPTTIRADRSMVAANGTTLAVHRQGRGQPVLLIHGGGEDASTLAAQAADLAAVGFEAITYDRRGTGSSGREDWPGAGATQHADDAAALIDALGLAPAAVLGVSSGGVVALDLAARHPDHVGQVVAWEPPAAGALADGPQLAAQIMAPVEAHLAANPGDFVGAQALMLSALVGFPVSVDDPAFAATRVHAEAMVLDDPTITLRRFGPADFVGADVTLAIGSAPNDLIAGAVGQLTQWTGGPATRVEAEHEVYLTEPTVLTSVVREALSPA